MLKVPTVEYDEANVVAVIVKSEHYLFSDILFLTNSFIVGSRMAQRGSEPRPPLLLHFQNNSKLLPKSIPTMVLMREVLGRRRSGGQLQETTGRRNLEKRRKEQGRMLR